jgi:hypothetical protein
MKRQRHELNLVAHQTPTIPRAGENGAFDAAVERFNCARLTIVVQREQRCGSHACELASLSRYPKSVTKSDV